MSTREANSLLSQRVQDYRRAIAPTSLSQAAQGHIIPSLRGVISREEIIEEIRRTAAGGQALGRRKFEHETGIRESDWSGRYWARWSDALAEAGFEANRMNEPYEADYIVQNLIAMIHELGRWPTNPERRLYRQRHPETPSHNTYYRLGNQYEQGQAVLDYSASNSVSVEVVAICSSLRGKRPSQTYKPAPKTGFVYLIKSGRHYKIGHSNDPSRRAYEIRLRMPESVTEVHRIETDDPAGVEAYWHRRFADRRAEGEWFKLSSGDVKVFKSKASM